MTTTPARWLILGASGLLGSNLGWALQGVAESIGACRSAPPRGLFSHWESVDVLDFVALTRLVQRVRADVVVNAAALASHAACDADPKLASQVNAMVPGELASISAETGCRFLHVSTDAVFPGTDGDYAETDDPEPFSVYGETKLRGEELVRLHDPTALIVRTNFFGWSPSGRRSILEFFVNAANANQRVNGYANQLVTSIYVQHLSHRLVALVGTPAQGVVHVASSDKWSKLEFGRAVFRSCGVDPKRVERTNLHDVTTSGFRDLSLNCALVRSLLGNDLPTQAAGLSQAFKDRALRAVLLDQPS